MPLLAQDKVVAGGFAESLPVLRQDNRPVADADLLPVLSLLNGQHALDRVRPPGVTPVSLPDAMGSAIRGNAAVVVVGTVMRTEAVLTPDRTGMATVLTVMPSAILQGAPTTATSGAAARRRVRVLGGGPAPPPPPQARVSGPLLSLRFVLAGGTIFFDDNNGMMVRQTGVRYAAPGTELVLAGAQTNGSTALLLQAACALRQGRCESIDGNPLTNDAISAGLPGGLAAAQAFSVAGAPVASADRTGVRGLARYFEDRYRLRAGDLRAYPDVVVPLREPFVPAEADALLVRAEVRQGESALLTDGTGVVTTSLVAVTKTIWTSGAPVRARTLDVVQRGGLLRKPDGSMLGALEEKERPLVEGGDYFLSLGRTEDNRWELRQAWCVVDGKVFAMDAPRTVALGASASVGTVESFLAKFQ